MRFDIVTIFPDAFRAPFDVGVVGRARAHGRADIRMHDLRDFAGPPHRRVDDEVYGGGAGMLYRPEPMIRAAEALRRPGVKCALVLPSPRGEELTQGLAEELAEYDQLVLLCDRYEGCDERVRPMVDYEVSLGDFVLTGGELAAMVIVDAVARLTTGVVGCDESVELDSFTAGRLDYGAYTRPVSYRGHDVPAVLRSGDHGAVDRWRQADSFRATLERRPDLMKTVPWAADERDALGAERRLER